jgi:hypothetical protein
MRGEERKKNKRRDLSFEREERKKALGQEDRCKIRRYLEMTKTPPHLQEFKSPKVTEYLCLDRDRTIGILG